MKINTFPNQTIYPSPVLANSEKPAALAKNNQGFKLSDLIAPIAGFIAQGDSNVFKRVIKDAQDRLGCAVISNATSSVEQVQLYVKKLLDKYDVKPQDIVSDVFAKAALGGISEAGMEKQFGEIKRLF